MTVSRSASGSATSVASSASPELLQGPELDLEFVGVQHDGVGGLGDLDRDVDRAFEAARGQVRSDREVVARRENGP